MRKLLTAFLFVVVVSIALAEPDQTTFVEPVHVLVRSLG